MRTLVEREKRNNFKLDILVASISFILFGLFYTDYVLLITYALVVPYMIITHRKHLIYHFVVASIMAAVWMALAKNQYMHNSYYYLSYMGVSLYPMLAWSLGLTGSYVAYLSYINKFKIAGFSRQLSVYLMLYWPLLIFVETIGYHLFGISNAATAVYAGLPLCDCIHAPLWMQVSYFAMGPLFFTASYIILKFQDDLRVILQKIMTLEKGGV